MTRKRFVKLIMARGVSRNEANELAESAVSGRVSYEKAYRAYDSLPTAIDAILATAEAAKRAVKAICDGMAVFSEAVSASLNRI